MDLLDISLGAASISSPTSNNDPWRSSSPAELARPKVIDPWGRTASPIVDPWQPSASNQTRPTTTGNNSNADGWLPRTQSPSVASGSSNEGWLQNNGSTPTNGNAVGTNDPWLAKGQPQQQPKSDPWLNSSTPVNDAWQPVGANNSNTIAGSNGTATSTDPWTPKSNNMGVSIYHVFTI